MANLLPPFHLIGIANDAMAIHGILRAAEEHSGTQFALMLRDPEHQVENVHALAKEVLSLPIPPNITLLSNGCQVAGIKGRHVTSQELQAGVQPNGRFGCSVHSSAEIGLAEKANADYVLLSPVFPTTSKPNAVPLGIQELQAFCVGTELPVFALGGISTADRARECLQAGAFGLAGIRLFVIENRDELRKIVSMMPFVAGKE